MRSEAVRNAQKRYVRKNVPMTFLFLPKKDYAIIQKLQAQPNKTEYLRNLIMRDIRFGGKFRAKPKQDQ